MVSFGMKRRYFSVGLIGILLLPTSMWAAQQERAYGLGAVAQNLMEPVGFFSDFIQSACFIIGGAFLIASIIKYIEHRRSPLMVPISTVVFLIIAGLVLIGLPFLTIILENGVNYSLLQ